MNPEQWSRVKLHFNEGLELTPAARGEWAERLAAEEPAVRSEVEELMLSYSGVASFLEAPLDVDPRDLAAPDDEPAPGERHDTLPKGTRIGDYEVYREIGRGGMGVVYLAQDLNLARPVALKALPTLTARDPMLLERLRREAQAAAAINHQGIAIVYAFLETPAGNFIASEYIQGRTLRQELQRGPIEPGRAVRLAVDIARALCAAHDAHVVHRDLKPENILITAGGAVKVIDFGIARVQRFDAPTLTVSGLVQGTPAYMAPEQFVSGSPVDGRADLYALGVILAEMLLGHHPFEGGLERMPPVLEPHVRQCLESDPERRYRSARDLLHDLERATLALDGAGASAALAERRADRGPMFWWQFHQAATAVIYWLMAVPAWYAQAIVGGRTGRTLFFVIVGALLLASILRLHLWFTSRTNRGELAMQVRREHPWIRAADVLLATALIVCGVLVGEMQMSLALLMLAAGIGAAVVAVFIEPATARAAFRETS